MPPPASRPSPSFLAGGGDMGVAIRAHDWAATSIGPPESWPQPLRTLVGVMLAAGQPMFTTWGPDRVMLYNDAYVALLGRKHPAALGQPFAMVWAEAWDELEPLFDRVSAGEPVHMKDITLFVDRNDGPQEAHFAFSYTPVLEETGTVKGMFCACNDTTEQVFADRDRHRAEAALRASETRFRTMVDSLPGFAWTADGRGALNYVSQRWTEYAGADGDRIAQRSWSDFVHPDDVERASRAWIVALKSGEPYDVEFRLRGRDGAYRWWLARARRAGGDSGQAVSWVGTCVDIQEITEAREVLSRSRSQLQRIVEERTAERDRLWTLSEDMLARADYRGNMSAVNPAWTRVLGYSEQELLTRPYAEIINPEDVYATVAALTRMWETGQPIRFENRVLASDGRWTPIEWIVAPEPDSEHFIAVGRDITALKAREAELEHTQEQLRQAQKMEAVGQLTGGIAHDFNNLLQGITGSLDLVQKRVAQGRTGEIDRFVGAAMTSANRAAALTHRLLAFSRRQPLDPRPVRVNRLIGSMEDLLRRTIGEHIALELVLAGGLWPTLCDPNQLESALLNLVINARDAMPEGGRLTIETCNAHLDDAYAARARDVSPGQYVNICVTDTGIGMERAVAERAFDPFFTTKAIGQGTGLGLSMIYGFARQSEGYCKIYSEVGEGTTVKLYLPRHRGETPDEQPALTLTEDHESEHGEVVVVIEDEPVVRDLIVEVLGELGYRALEAADGPAGLKLLDTQPRVDLLITDIGLPGMNGRDIAAAARQRRPGLKVLFMTGYAENAAVAGGFLEFGMAMITKPFALEQLASRVRDMLEAR